MVSAKLERETNGSTLRRRVHPPGKVTRNQARLVSGSSPLRRATGRIQPGWRVPGPASPRHPGNVGPETLQRLRGSLDHHPALISFLH